MPFRRRDWYKNIPLWLREEAETIVHFAQFRMRGYAIEVQQWEDADGVHIHILLPFPKEISERIRKEKEKLEREMKKALEKGEEKTEEEEPIIVP